MSVKRISNKVYEVVVRFNGKQIRRRFQSKWDAQDFDAYVSQSNLHPDQAEAVVRAGLRKEMLEAWTTGHGPNAVPTFEDFARKEWTRDLVSGSASRRDKGSKAGTVHRTMNFLSPSFRYIGSKRLDVLTIGDYNAVHAALKTEPLSRKGTIYSPAVGNKCLLYMKNVMNHAIHMGHIQVNPFVAGKMIHAPKTRKPHWNLDEAAKFLSLVRERNFTHYCFFLIALQTGLRRHEIFGIRVKDILMNEGVIHCQQFWDAGAYEFPPKGEPRRIAFQEHTKVGQPEKTVPMTQLVQSELLRFTESMLPEARIFQEMTIGDIKNPGALIKKYAPEAGVPVYKFHATRDSFIGNMKRAGVSPVHIAQIAGCNLSNLERYGHIKTDDVKQAVNVLKLGIKSDV